MTATYEVIGQLTLTSDPPGIPLQVDGVACSAPCRLERSPGTQVRISAPVAQTLSNDSRLVFQGWGDSAEPVLSVSVPEIAKVVTANYLLQNRLSLGADPPEGVSWSVTPASSDAFYDAGTQVTVSVEPRPGYRFMNWEGDIAGRSRSAQVWMDAPKSARVRLDPIPYIAPAGVRSAANSARTDAVAPGSLISIFGLHLAGEYQAGPASPLAQTLGGVTVRVDDFFLPLVFVSSEQINAQLQYAIGEGRHTLILRSEGRPETAVDINVSARVPGLFSRSASEPQIGLFFRKNGEVITPESPARKGEVISVAGTGLGPYVRPPLDGFLFDESAGYTLADSVSVLLGNDTLVETLYAGRSAMGVGVDAVQFQVPLNPSDSLLPVKIQVNGQESNVVFLPVAQ